MYILTFAELEALASLGLTGFLTFNRTGIAGHEAELAEECLVVGVNLNKCAGDTETKCFSLAFVAATVKVDMNVVLLCNFESCEGLLNDELKNRRGEIHFEGALVDSDGAVTLFEDYTSHGGFAAAYCIYCFHVVRLFHFVDINDFGILCLVGMVGTIVNVHVFDEATTQTVLGEHTLHNANEEGMDSGLDVLVE